MILPCTCENKFQDNAYGKGNRIHNYAPKVNSGSGGYRCTVCLKIKGNPKKKEEETRKK